METLNPNDIGKLDFDTISFITLINGDIIMIDSSVPEKYKSEKQRYKNDLIQKNNTLNNLSVSKQLTFTFKGKNKFNKNIDKFNNQKIMKSDFNSVSFPSKSINLCYKGKSNKLILDNIPNLNIKENIKKNSLFQYNTNNDKKKSFNKPEIKTDLNINSNTNENALKKINENNYFSERNSYLSSSTRRNNLNIQTNELTEEEKLDMRIKRKSRNYLEKLSLTFGEKNKPLVNAVISLKIPSDINKQLSEAEIEFDKMVTHLKQKRSKYNMNRKGDNIYQRYYELYKDNNKEYKYFNLNRIKYYQESEIENKENEQQMNTNENFGKSQLNLNKLDNNNTINNTFYGGFINKGNNKSSIGSTDANINNKTANSFYGDKMKTSRENKLFNRIKDGSNPSLVCPSNIIKGKLNTDF